MQEKHASQGKANIKPEGEDNDGRSNLSVTDIPESEDSHQNCDGEINKEKILKETIKTDENTEARTSSRQCKIPSNQSDDFL
jgi:hypothetical protein